MSSLNVEHRILRYKGISYQISQITSMKVVEIKIKNKEKASLESLKTSLPIALAGVFLGSMLSNDLGALLIVIGIISGIYSYFIIKAKLDEMKKEKYHILYGLSLRMSNGDDPIYTTTDKGLIFNIRDAISESMNKDGESVSVNFDNVNIDITDSEKVEIGNVVKR